MFVVKHMGLITLPNSGVIAHIVLTVRGGLDGNGKLEANMIYVAVAIWSFLIGGFVGAVLIGLTYKAKLQNLVLKKAAEVIQKQILLGNITFSPKYLRATTPKPKKEFVN